MPGMVEETIGDQYTWNEIKFRNRHFWGEGQDQPTVSGPTAEVVSYTYPTHAWAGHWYPWFSLSDDMFDLRGRSFTIQTKFAPTDEEDFMAPSFLILWGGPSVEDMSNFECYAMEIQMSLQVGGAIEVAVYTGKLEYSGSVTGFMVYDGPSIEIGVDVECTFNNFDYNTIKIDVDENGVSSIYINDTLITTKADTEGFMTEAGRIGASGHTWYSSSPEMVMDFKEPEVSISLPPDDDDLPTSGPLEAQNEVINYFGSCGAVGRFGGIYGTEYRDGVFDDGNSETGMTASATSTTLTIATNTFKTDDNGLENLFVYIINGTGAGQVRRITSNTNNTLTVSPAWTTTPDSTSGYAIGAVQWRWQSKSFASRLHGSIRMISLRLNAETEPDAARSPLNLLMFESGLTSDELPDTETTSMEIAAADFNNQFFRFPSAQRNKRVKFELNSLLLDQRSAINGMTVELEEYE